MKRNSSIQHTIMTLSLVIPYMNEEEHIQGSIDAILKQTELPDEIIYIDNGTTDNTTKILKKNFKRFKRVGIQCVLVEHTDGHQAHARRFGFDIAKGNLIASLDVDSQPVPDWIERGKKRLRENRSLVGLGGYVYFHNISLWNNIKIFPIFLLYALSQRIIIMWGSNMLFRKEAYTAVNGLDGYEEMEDELQLKYVYDDAFISEKLKARGKLKFDWKLYVSAQARGNAERGKAQARDTPRVMRFARNLMRSN